MVFLAILIASGLVLSGCSNSSTGTNAEVKYFDVGVGTILSGPAANLGLNFQRGVQMAIDDLNAEGGVVIGGQKYTLRLIARDTKFDPATAKTVAEEFVYDKKVKVIFGPSQNEMTAMQQITNDNKVFLFGMSPMPELTNKDLPYNFFLGGIAEEMVLSGMDYAAKAYPAAKRVISFEPDLPDASLWGDASKAVCTQYGLNWLGMEKFPFTTQDFAPFAQKLLSYNPDIIDLCGSGGATGAVVGTMIKQIREAGFNGVFVLPTAPPPGILDTLPVEYLNKVICNVVDENSTVAAKAYTDLIKRYQKEYGSLPIDFLQSVYNGAYGFFSFINGQKDMDTQRWMTEFANYKWTAAYGQQSSWIGTEVWGINRAERTTYWVSEYKNGQLYTVNANIPADFLEKLIKLR